MFRMLRCVVLVVLLVSIEGYRYSEKDKQTEEDEDTLVLSSVVFRHGDRTPDVSTIYPTDPYINETYFPFGKGQLTMQGKERAYKLGKSLRRRYDHFLKSTYYPDLLEALSSAYPRTQMTLQLVLAGLFPPAKDSLIDYELNWQPIPYTYNEYAQDKLIATFRSCDKMFDIANDLEKTDVYQKQLKQYSRLYQYLSMHTGWAVNGTNLLFSVQNTLQTEAEWGFQLPEWAKQVYPGILREAASNFWKVMSSTVELRRMAIGNLLKKIVEDSMKKAENTLVPENRKLFLYSGHDFTIVPLLAALGNYEGEHTPYTAHILFELHKIDDIYGLKIYFQDYENPRPKLLNIPMCGTFCPVLRFAELMQDHFPGEEWCP